MHAYARSLALLVLMLLFVTIQPVAAQDAAAPVCTPFVEVALAEVGTLCGGMERNTVCYGYNRVNASFNQPVEPDFFSQPSDRAQLIDVERLQTMALSLDRQEWGVAVMNVQANIPGTLPGQAVTFILIGDATLDNGVAPETAQTALADPVEVVAAVNANIRSGPGTATNVVGGVNAGTTLQADGLSSDQAWLRVLHGESPAWISRSVLNAADGIDALPVVDEAFQTPMQAFYFRTGTSEPECADFAPSALVIQGPERVNIDLTMNGAQVTVGSTIVLTQPDNKTLKCTVIDGSVRFPSGLTVPAGFAVEADLDEDGEVTSNWGGFHGLTDSELDELSFINLLPDDLFNYAVELPTRAEIQAVQNAVNAVRATAVPSDTPPAPDAPLPVDVTPGPPAGFDPNDIYVRIWAEPPSIPMGQCTTVHWNTRNTREVWFEGQQNIGTNSVQRCPSNDTSYTIQVFYYDGTSSFHTVNVDVIEPSPTPRSCTQDNNYCDEPDEIN